MSSTGTTAGNHDDEYKSGIGYHPTTTNNNNNNTSNHSNTSNLLPYDHNSDSHNHCRTNHRIIVVEQLLRECWEYHQEQEIIRCHHHHAGDDEIVVVIGNPSTGSSSHGTIHGNPPSIVPVLVPVVPPLPPPPPPPPPPPTFVMPSRSDTTETAMPPPTITITDTHHLEPCTHHISAIEQARNIALRFAPAPINVTTKADHNIYSTPSNNGRNVPVGDDDYIQQRQIGFQREEQRKHKAMIRNFQYLYDQQQYLMAQLNARILQTTSTATTWTTTALPPLPLVRHDDRIGQTKAISVSTRNHPTTLPTMTTTNQRQRSDRHRRHDDDDGDDHDDDGDTDHHQQQQLDDNTTTTTNATTGTVTSTVAIYISTEPAVSTVASSSTSSNSDHPPPLHLYWNESYLQQLFQTYGTIRNIYLYRHRNKRKGRLGDYKGDGIIVYKLSRNAANDGDDDDQVDDTLRQQRQKLIELICGQMSGAELPCGTILHVEPATGTTDTAATTTTNMPPEPLEPTMVADASPVATNESARSSTSKDVVADTMTTLHPSDHHNHYDGHADADDDDLDEFFDSL